MISITSISTYWNYYASIYAYSDRLIERPMGGNKTCD